MTIKQERINRVLNQRIDIDGGTWTRKQWIDYQYGVYGRKAHTEDKPKYIFNRDRYNSLSGEDQQTYEAKMKETVPAYMLDGRYITKIEYEYCLSLVTLPVRTEEPATSYQSLMEDPAIAKIVHQLQETEDLDEWWSLVEDLKTICSKKEIDLIDDAHAWNINE